jgi:hypothetical protein
MYTNGGYICSSVFLFLNNSVDLDESWYGNQLLDQLNFGMDQFNIIDIYPHEMLLVGKIINILYYSMLTV